MLKYNELSGLIHSLSQLILFNQTVVFFFSFLPKIIEFEIGSNPSEIQLTLLSVITKVLCSAVTSSKL